MRIYNLMLNVNTGVNRVERAGERKFMESKWYVLSFTSNKFRSVEKFFKLKDVHYFCPMREQEYRRPDKVHCVRKSYVPEFPGYLFIQLDFNKIHPENLSSFQYIYGLITFGNQPLEVPEKLVDDLRKACLVEKTDESIIKSISHEFAAILLNEDPQKRSIMLLDYLCKCHSQSFKEVKYAS